MMDIPISAAAKSAATFDAAAGSFDRPEVEFWNRHGRNAVKFANLGSGEHVLDVGCGTGASALPAGKAVGAKGQVIGVDVSAGMLSVAREKARAKNLGNVMFREADMRATGYPDEHFDAVISVFSVFFVPDMKAQLGELWRMVAPGGRLVVTIWKTGAFEPLLSNFAEVALPYGLKLEQRPWKRLTTGEALTRLFKDAGVTAPKLHAVSDEQPLTTTDSWWAIVMGTGYRWELEQLPVQTRAELKLQLLSRLAEIGATAMSTSTITAVATKAG